MKKRPGRAALVLAVMVAAATAVFAGVFATRLSEDSRLSDSPLVGAPSPVMTLPLLDGSGEIEIPEPDARVTVINFFASWCLECRIEHPDLLAVAEAFSDSGVRLIQIAYQDRPDDSIAFMNELGVSPLIRYASDPGSRAAIAFGVFGIPETYFIGPDGVVTGRITGPADSLSLGRQIDLILGRGRPE
ncbi:MAG: redoxin domain-containing protein [bacterium]|nr:redoxin domain-containing protein [bacterium]MDE0601614.1 redoxin domain-containing protein [bacterium]